MPPKSGATARSYVREDKPISTLRTTISNQDDVVVLEGTALVYRAPI
jgi:hypothetical protein